MSSDEDLYVTISSPLSPEVTCWMLQGSLLREAREHAVFAFRRNRARAGCSPTSSSCTCNLRSLDSSCPDEKKLDTAVPYCTIIMADPTSKENAVHNLVLHALT